MTTEIVINFSCRIDEATGKQVSSNTTIHRAMDEIESFLSNADTTKNDELRKELTSKLRKLLKEDIEESNQEWFKYGFHIGHLHSYNAFLNEKVVPVKLRRILKRRFSETDPETKFVVNSTAYDIKNPPASKKTGSKGTTTAKDKGNDESNTSIQAQIKIVHKTRKGMDV